MQEGKSIFLVTGDPTRNKELCLPGGGSATVKIHLPAAWDALMAERGYKPLASFYLKSDLRPDRPKPLPKGYSRPGVRGDRQEGNAPQQGGYSRPGGRGDRQEGNAPQKGYSRPSGQGERNDNKPSQGGNGRNGGNGSNGKNNQRRRNNQQ